MPLVSAQSSMAVQIAPDCDTSARSPSSVAPWLKVALSPIDGRWMPRQLGPMKRMPCRFATVFRFSSSAAPFSPISRNPADSTMAWRMPRCPHSSRICATVAAGVAISASSGTAGSSRALAKQRTPYTVSYFGLTG